MSKKLLAWIIIILGALFVAGVIVIILGGATEEAPPAPISTTTASGDLHITSQIEASWIGRDNPVQFWLQIENTGKSAIAALTLEPLDAPGFLPDGCDCQAPGVSCPVSEKTSTNPSANSSTAPLPSDSSTPMCSMLADSLAPGQKITVWIHLRSEEVHRSEILSAGISWKDAADHTSSVAAPVGPIAIRSRLDEWIQARVALFQGLALPLATFLLGGIFSVAKYYSDRADKEADDRRAQLTQTWNQMLPASHKLALGHYVPMSAALHEALDWLAKADPANASAPAAPVAGKGVPGAPATAPAAAPPWDEPKLKRAFYGLMLFESRVRNTTTKVRGFYFKDRTGEKIVSRCYLRYRETFYRKDSAEQIAVEKVRDLVPVDMDLKDFEAAWTNNKTLFDDLYAKFKAWTVKPDGYPVAKKILTALRAVLDYESNRPYEYWYGKRDRLSIEDGAEKMLRGDWSGITDTVEAAAFQKAVIAYLNENEKDPGAETEAPTEHKP
jgi:hypothetical protein